MVRDCFGPLLVGVALATTGCGRLGFNALPDSASGPGLYISPAGSDDADGSREAPFRTFSFAISRLSPGDTLIALPGTYGVSAGTGTMAIDCGAASDACDGGPCPVGEGGAPIVIRAMDERTAWLVGEAGMPSEAILVRSCQHYLIEGFTVVGVDDGETSWANVQVSDSSDIVLRRNLVSRSNRMVNGHLIDVLDCTDVLVEENELYDFHRIAVIVYGSSRVALRRNYANARSFADISGGYASGIPASGDVAFACFHSASCTVENNVSEGDTGSGFRLEASILAPDAIPSAGDGARYLGNVGLGAGQIGIYVASGCAGLDVCPEEVMVSDVVLRDNLFMDSEDVNIFVRGAEEVVLDHNSILGGGVRIDLAPDNASMAASVTVTNNLSEAPDVDGITIIQQDTWTMAHNNSVGVPGGFDTDGDLTGWGENNDSFALDLGGCVHRIPGTSRFFAAGDPVGTPIGATIVKRYVDGVVTAEPLWDPVTGAFPCGAIVPGINDTGDVCSGLHTRLGVGTTCPVE